MDTLIEELTTMPGIQLIAAFTADDVRALNNSVRLNWTASFLAAKLDVYKDERVVETMSGVVEANKLRVARFVWKGEYPQSIGLAVQGQGADALASLSHVAHVNLEQLTKNITTVGAIITPAWDSNHLHVGLPRGVIQALSEAALKSDKSDTDSIGAHCLSTKLVDTRQPMMKCSLAASFELSSDVSTPTSCVFGQITYMISYSPPRR